MGVVSISFLSIFPPTHVFHSLINSIIHSFNFSFFCPFVFSIISPSSNSLYNYTAVSHVHFSVYAQLITNFSTYIRMFVYTFINYRPKIFRIVVAIMMDRLK